MSQPVFVDLASVARLGCSAPQCGNSLFFCSVCRSECGLRCLRPFAKERVAELFRKFQPGEVLAGIQA